MLYTNSYYKLCINIVVVESHKWMYAIFCSMISSIMFYRTNLTFYINLYFVSGTDTKSYLSYQIYLVSSYKSFNLEKVAEEFKVWFVGVEDCHCGWMRTLVLVWWLGFFTLQCLWLDENFGISLMTGLFYYCNVNKLYLKIIKISEFGKPNKRLKFKELLRISIT